MNVGNSTVFTGVGSVEGAANTSSSSKSSTTFRCSWPSWALTVEKRITTASTAAKSTFTLDERIVQEPENDD